jgi:DNA ligase-1
MTKAFLTRRLALGAVLLGHWPWTAALAQTLPANGSTSQAVPLTPMLGKNWHPGLNPADFLVSEKLDGVRALWDGQLLRFRSGRRIVAPGWFLAGLPTTPLDGELWLGRGSFDRLSGIVRRSTPMRCGRPVAAMRCASSKPSRTMKPGWWPMWPARADSKANWARCRWRCPAASVLP